MLLTINTHRPGHCRGFTLAELVIVLTILSITVVLTLPRLAGLLQSNALKEASTLLTQHVVLARDKAMLRQERWGVLLDLQAQTVRVQGLDNATGAVSASAAPLPQGAFVKTVTVAGSTVTSGQAVIRFLPSGLAEPCRITFDNAEDSVRRLELGTTGARLVPVTEYTASEGMPSKSVEAQREPAWETLP